MSASAISRPRIVHVSGDFPDNVAPFKTPVIRSFIELTASEFDHEVVSINRRTPAFGELAAMALSPSISVPNIEAKSFEFGTELQYAAPSHGVLHKTRLKLLGDWLAAHIEQMPQRPDLLIAHKLTIEGIAIQRASRILGIPYALTIQGNTDQKILAARPDLIGTFRSIYRDAAKVFTFAPIAKHAIERRLGIRPDGIKLIPCPTELDTITPPSAGGDGLISVFHLKNHKVKNLRGMAGALMRASPSVAPRLTIIGGGTESQMLECKAITRDCPTVEFAGALERNLMSQRMNVASALVQPSVAESFGLVFIEALFAGLPIIYPSGTGIDGYFDGAAFALRVNPHSPDSILAAMKQATDNEGQMKDALANWQESEDAAIFTRPAIASAFTNLLNQALSINQDAKTK